MNTITIVDQRFALRTQVFFTVIEPCIAIQTMDEQPECDNDKKEQDPVSHIRCFHSCLLIYPSLPAYDNIHAEACQDARIVLAPIIPTIILLVCQLPK